MRSQNSLRHGAANGKQRGMRPVSCGLQRQDAALAAKQLTMTLRGSVILANQTKKSAYGLAPTAEAPPLRRCQPAVARRTWLWRGG